MRHKLNSKEGARFLLELPKSSFRGLCYGCLPVQMIQADEEKWEILLSQFNSKTLQEKKKSQFLLHCSRAVRWAQLRALCHYCRNSEWMGTQALPLAVLCHCSSKSSAVYPLILQATFCLTVVESLIWKQDPSPHLDVLEWWGAFCWYA